MNFLRLLSTLGATSALAFAAVATPPAVTIHEAFFTSRSFADNIDSVATWHGPDGQQWLFSTAKSTHSIVIDDALNGAFIRRLGGRGSELGQFDRPNGIWVEGDLLWIVERDNARTQVFVLPELLPIGTFGEGELIKPYGLYVERKTSELFHVYITDNYETPEGEVPPTAELGRRVALYEVEVEGRVEGTMDAEFIRYIGETSGPGALRTVESLYGDPAHGRLLIAEEDESHETTGVKVYTFDGRFTGTILGQADFSGQPEGIALVSTGETSGYWVLADQGKEGNFFHLYDRESLAHLGSISGTYVLNTDGIWYDPTPTARFPAGALYVVQNDHAAAAFDWQLILDALHLP